MSRTYANPPIVVGIDGSDNGLRAVDWAARESLAAGRPLRLVNAYQLFVSWTPMRPDQIEAIARDQSRMMLDAARKHARYLSKDLATVVVPCLGPATKVLLDQADNAHLLVLGRRGAGLFSELVLGSTSLACATRSHTPVVVVPDEWRPDGPRFDRIILGVDGSSRSEAATEFAFDRASRTGAEIAAVMAWELHNPYALRAAVLAEEVRAWELETADRLEKALAPWREKYPSVSVSRFAEFAHPVAALTHRSDSADLLVVGGRGHGALTALLLGSAARGILHHARCPIAVVHPPKSVG